MSSIKIEPVTTQRGRRAFVKFPWRVYEDDPNWVPPLISEQLDYLDPATGPFYEVSFETFRDLIAQELQVEKDRVVREASFVDDLLADSIKLVEMMLDMEARGIEIPVELAWEVETVGDAYRLYRQHAASS